MANKTRGLALITAGVLLALVSLAADALGLGGHPGIGWKQILGIVAGIGVAVMGLGDLRR